MKINHTINEFLIHKSTDQPMMEVELQLELPTNADYFDGHFNDFPILPGIVQLYLVKSYTTKYLGINLKLTNISNIKFLKPIFPNDLITLCFKINEKGRVSFEYLREKVLCSKGEFYYI